MRARQLQLLITFPTTSAAMALEAAAGRNGLPGRLIPLPTLLSAGCGLAWSAPPEAQERFAALLEQEHLTFEKLCTIVW